MQYAVNVKYDDEHEGQFYLNAILLSKIEVTTPPLKTAYKNGEIISYFGMTVTATYQDDTTKDVTSQCIITPSAGNIFNDNNYVEILYSENQDEKSCSLNLTTVTLSSISLVSLPTKTSYNSGEVADYTGISIKATYSDGSEADVTNLCTFAPIAGTAINSDTQVTVSYTENQTTQTCNFQLTVAAPQSSLLEITTMPTKVNYSAGETISYSGLVVSAVYDDGTKHDVTSWCDFSPANGSAMPENDLTVTVSCAPPLTPAIYDLNYGYVDSGIWKYENPTNTYIDVYEVEAGHQYYITLGATVGSRFRAMFTTEDVSQSKVNITGTRIINQNNPSTYAHVTYTPSSNGYIIIAKDNVGVSGLSSYVYDISATQKSESITFDLYLPGPVSLEVIEYPNKYVYCEGELISYDGILVYAKNSDDSETDVTSSCTFSPAAGKAFDSQTDTTVTVTYGRVETTFNFSAYSIQVTTLPRTIYASGDALSYEGLVVSENIGNIQLDIGYICDISPVNGSILTQNPTTVNVRHAPLLAPYASDVRYGDVYGSAWWYGSSRSNCYTDVYRVQAGHSYRINSGSVSTGAIIFVTTDITSVRSTTYGTEISFEYSNYGSKVESYSAPSDGYILVCKGYGYKGNTTYRGFGTYVRDLGAAKTQTVTFNIELSMLYSVTVTNLPEKLEYSFGESLDYSGCVVTAYYENGGSIDVTDLVTFSPVEGTVYDSSISSIAVSFTSGDVTMTDSFALTAATPTSIEITTTPARTRYAYGDTITYQGIAITATYSNGSTVDVTSLVSYSTAEGSAFDPTTDTSVTISFTDIGVTRTCTLSLTEGEPVLEKIAVTTNPTKMSYRVIDETYDYTGIVVTGIYSDLTTANVTNLCTFEPAQGTHEDFRSDLSTTISYDDKICSLNFTRILPIWNGISLVSPPTKTYYVAGEVFDFSGLAVKVDYEDGSSLIINDIWDPGLYNTDEYRYRKGGIGICSDYNLIDSNIYDPSKHSELYCVYYEKAEDFWSPSSWNNTNNLSFNVKLKDLDYITVNTKPTKTVYSQGEVIDYSGLIVNAHYNDGSSMAIPAKRVKNDETHYIINSTGYITIPEEGENFDTSKRVAIAYTYTPTGTTRTCNFVLNEATTLDMTLKVTQLPDKVTYAAGDILNYMGVVVKDCLSDGTNSEIDVTNLCEFTPANGSSLPESNPITITVKCPPSKSTLFYDYEIGYVSNGTWIHEEPSNSRSDIYAVTSGHSYFISLGAVVGTRFRAMFTTVDVTTTTQASVSGTTIIDSGSPSAYANINFTATDDGYIIITKDNVGTEGLRTYVYDTGAGKTRTTTFDVGQVGTIASGMKLNVAKQPDLYAVNEGETLTYLNFYIKGIAFDGTGSEVLLSYSRIDPEQMKLFGYPILKYVPAEGSAAILGTKVVNVSCDANLVPIAFDLYSGVINGENWKVDVSTSHYSDIYEVQAGHNYWLYQGKNVTEGLIILFTTVDVRQTTSDIAGVLISCRVFGELECISASQIPSNGYLIITKTQSGIAKLTTYLFDAGV